MLIRRQLSLFVPSDGSAQLEALRTLLDPVQASLIPAHATLCRETDIGHLTVAGLEARLRSSIARAITLQFGRPVAFHGHGVLLPCIAGDQDFQALRAAILGTPDVRRHAPHITLAHPRNPSRSSNPLALAGELPATLSYTFSSIALIEQLDTTPWRVLLEVGLN
jgi:2'-5' RNA ligase